MITTSVWSCHMQSRWSTHTSNTANTSICQILECGMALTHVRLDLISGHREQSRPRGLVSSLANLNPYSGPNIPWVPTWYQTWSPQKVKPASQPSRTKKQPPKVFEITTLRSGMASWHFIRMVQYMRVGTTYTTSTLRAWRCFRWSRMLSRGAERDLLHHATASQLRDMSGLEKEIGWWFVTSLAKQGIMMIAIYRPELYEFQSEEK